jgi:Terminase small subunit
MAELASKTAVTSERVLQEFAKLAFSNIEDLSEVRGTNRVPALAKATRDQLAAVQSIEITHKGDVKFKLASKVAALEALGKHLGLFPRENASLQVNGSLEQWVMAVHEKAESKAIEGKAEDSSATSEPKTGRKPGKAGEPPQLTHTPSHTPDGEP